MPITELTAHNFDALTATAETPTLVEFYAPWCGHCHKLAPILEQLALDYAGVCNVARADIDADPDLGSRFDIRSVPTLMLFKNGRHGRALVGPDSKAAIEELIRQ